MTKKDYVIIADAIAASARKALNISQGKRVELGDIHQCYVKSIAMALSHDNPRFDAGRFEKYISQNI